MLKNVIFCEMVILVVFKAFLLVKNLEILVRIVPDCPICSYYDRYHFDVLFRYNFDGWKIDANSTCFFY